MSVYELHRYIFEPNGEKGVFLLISVDVSLICLKEMERPRNVLKNVSQHFSVLYKGNVVLYGTYKR